MISFKDKQKLINNKYIEFCNDSNFQGIKDLCENKLPYKKTWFDSFLNIFLQTPTVDFFFGSGINTLCKKGNTEIISYIISHPNFQNQLLDVKNSTVNIQEMSDCCFVAAKNGHFDCARLLTSFVNQPENNMTEAYHQFVSACSSGNLEFVKFLTTNPSIKHNVNYTFNNKLDEFHPTNEAFIAACENGHLDIVKYLLESKDIPENINLKHFEKKILIDNPDIIRYFIFDLNLPRNHIVFSKITSYQSENNLTNSLVEELLDKRDLFENINSNLSTKSELMPSKKLKI